MFWGQNTKGYFLSRNKVCRKSFGINKVKLDRMKEKVNKESVLLKLFIFLGLLYLTGWFYTSFKATFYGLILVLNLVLLILGIFVFNKHKIWFIFIFLLGLIYYLIFYIFLPMFLKSSECDSYLYRNQIGYTIYTSCDCKGVKVFNGSKSRCYGERLNYINKR